MSLPGLPPLPKSLSTVESTGAHPYNTSNFGSIESQRGVSPVNRKTSTLDTQLAILRREMVSSFLIILGYTFANKSQICHKIYHFTSYIHTADSCKGLGINILKSYQNPH